MNTNINITFGELWTEKDCSSAFYVQFGKFSTNQESYLHKIFVETKRNQNWKREQRATQI